jgi:PAS domain S-box-containing protein
VIKEDFPLVLPLAFTQTALQRSVEYRQLAIEGSPTGMLMVDAAGTLVRVNGQFEMLFGYPGAELLGQRIEILNPIRPRGRHGSLRPSEGALDLGSKEVEQQMTARVDAAGDAIVINGLDGVIRSWNPAAERLLGFCTEQIVGQPIARIIPEDRQEEGSMILEQVRRGDTVEHLETVRRRQDGSLCDVSLTISPLRDGTGTVVGASKFMRDITDRKQIEAQLKMTNERFAIASEAAGLGFWDFEIGSNTLCWDDKMFEIYGRSHLKGEQPYALWVEALHPEDRARSEHELAQAINGTR